MSKIKSMLLLCTSLSVLIDVNIKAKDHEEEDLYKNSTPVTETERLKLDQFFIVMNFKYGQALSKFNASDFTKKSNFDLDDFIQESKFKNPEVSYEGIISDFLKKFINHQMQKTYGDIRKAQPLFALYSSYSRPLQTEISRLEQFVDFFNFHAATIYPEIKEITRFVAINKVNEVHGILSENPSASNSEIMVELLDNVVASLLECPEYQKKDPEILWWAERFRIIECEFLHYLKKPTRVQDFEHFFKYQLELYPSITNLNSKEVIESILKDHSDLSNDTIFKNPENSKIVQELIPIYRNFRNFMDAPDESRDLDVFYNLLADHTYPVLKYLDKRFKRLWTQETYFVTCPDLKPHQHLQNHLNGSISKLAENYSSKPKLVGKLLDNLLPVFSHMSRFPNWPSPQEKFMDYFTFFGQAFYPELIKICQNDDYAWIDRDIFSKKDIDKLSSLDLMKEYISIASTEIIESDGYKMKEKEFEYLPNLVKAQTHFKNYPTLPTTGQVFDHYYQLHADKLFPELKELSEYIDIQKLSTQILKKNPDLNVKQLMRKTIQRGVNTVKENLGFKLHETLEEFIEFFRN
ncbi:MAG: hypothetical protein ACRYGR_03020 [Janthinobacterium lividum]